MPKTCLIHIGTPKTGTSSLQATLFAARDELLKHGVNYFDFAENHNMVAAIFKDDSPLETQLIIPHQGLTQGKRQHLKSALLDAVKSNTSETFIISGEALSMLSHRSILNFKALLAPHFEAFKIIVYVRDPFSFAKSAAQQLIKSGAYNERVFENTLYDSHPQWGSLRPFYRQRIENYLSIFGEENTIVKEFKRSNLKNQSIIDDFFYSALDYQGDFGAIENIRKNDALDHDLVQLLEALNMKTPPMIANTQNPERSATLVMRLKDYSKTTDIKKYVPSKFDLDKFIDVIKDDVKWLDETCGIKFDLQKPNWKDQAIDLGTLASFVNHMSLGLETAADNQKILRKRYHDLQEKNAELQNEASRLNNRYALLSHRILITKGKANKMAFQGLLQRVNDIEILQTTAKALLIEKCDEFADMIHQRIKNIHEAEGSSAEA